jgi:hypothetical protein
MALGDFYTPDIPKRCIGCGTPYGLTRQPFRLRGAGLFSWPRPVDLYTCYRCWRDHLRARQLARYGACFFLVATALGVALSVLTGTVLPSLVGPILGTAPLVVVDVVLRRHMPRHRRRDRDAVVLDVKDLGEVRVPLREDVVESDASRHS